MDPFTTLGVPRRFDLDLSALEKTHRELSRTVHPDKLGPESSHAEKRATLEKAADVNEAFRILRAPIARAEALFRTAGLLVEEGEEPKSSPLFLMEMLDEREALAEARAKKDLDRVVALGEKVAAREKAALAKLAQGFAEAKVDTDAPDVAKLRALLPQLGELRYYRRFLDEVSAIEDEAMT